AELVGTALQSFEQRAGDCGLVRDASLIQNPVGVAVPEVRIEAAEQIVRECRVSERLTDAVGGHPRNAVLLARLNESCGMVAKLTVIKREIGLRRSEDGMPSPIDRDLVKSDKQNLWSHDRHHLLGAQDGLISPIAASACIDDRQRRQLFDNGWPAFVVLDLPAFGER